MHHGKQREPTHDLMHPITKSNKNTTPIIWAVLKLRKYWNTSQTTSAEQKGFRNVFPQLQQDPKMDPFTKRI